MRQTAASSLLNGRKSKPADRQTDRQTKEQTDERTNKTDNAAY